MTFINLDIYSPLFLSLFAFNFFSQENETTKTISQARQEAQDKHFQEAPVFGLTAILAQHECVTQLQKCCYGSVRAREKRLKEEEWHCNRRERRSGSQSPAAALCLLLLVLWERAEHSPLSNPNACTSPISPRSTSYCWENPIFSIRGLHTRIGFNAGTQAEGDDAFKSPFINPREPAVMCLVV